MYIHDTIEHDFLVKVYRGKWNRRTRLIRQIAQKIGIFRREEREREGYVLFISRSSTISRDRFLLSPFKKKNKSLNCWKYLSQVQSAYPAYLLVIFQRLADAKDPFLCRPPVPRTIHEFDTILESHPSWETITSPSTVLRTVLSVLRTVSS